ncbi:MAG: hypothetical protein CMQ41_12945 [Gammaproteobacteria bacterium]|nr:hypothetical protein [Gammaproteobacteria bacterium]|tara:strand:- start:838 stop:1257 length:420 start_codon:yes stop_codon:yes gene_type:complete
MNIRRILTMLAVTASAGIVMLVLPVLAHHASTPFYDPDNVVDLQGTVTRFVFRNPHAFLFINVPEEDGQGSEWQIELGAPVGLRRIGWTPDTLPVGMEVALTGRRSRAEGSQGVCCVRMTKADGSPVLEGGAVREREQN